MQCRRRNTFLTGLPSLCSRSFLQCIVYIIVIEWVHGLEGGCGCGDDVCIDNCFPDSFFGVIPMVVLIFQGPLFVPSFFTFSLGAF